MPFRAIAEMGNEGILVCNAREKIVFANRVAAEIIECSRDELLGKGLPTLLGKQYRALLKDIQKDRRKYGRKFCTEMEIVTPRGDVKEAEVCIASAKSNGKMKTFVYLKDITDRKQFEREMRESEEKFKNLFERVRHGIFISTKEGKFLDCNPAMLEMLGYRSKRELLEMDIAKDLYVNPEDRRIFRRLVERNGFAKDFEVEFKRRDGRKITILLTAHPIRDERGETIGYEGLNIDITDRKEMEKQLEETHLQLVNSEKMASLGKLAAGIAHEINNPMGGILIYSSLMMEALEEEDARRQDLERIVQEATRCKEIVKSLLEFSRQTEPKMEPTDINKAIMDDLFFLENQALFHNIEIVKNLETQLPRVRGNASQLKQVFMNIIVNAAEAMHEGGTLTITTGISGDKEEIWVEFSDTGEGISQENLSRIFDPFFTTKEVGKGTGLGLSTSYGIIDGHGGRIDVKSKIGKGTTFRIELPVEPEDAKSL